MWPFRKKPGWTEEYAQRTLRWPLVAHPDKILTQREVLCLAALGAALEQGPALKPVAQEFVSLIMAKMSARGLQLARDQLAGRSATSCPNGYLQTRCDGVETGLPSSEVIRRMPRWPHCLENTACGSSKATRTPIILRRAQPSKLCLIGMQDIEGVSP